ncbi:hypothetical protein DIPPA_65099, partial [Diplonema papillatum]
MLQWGKRKKTHRPDVSSLRVIPRILENAGASVSGKDDCAKILTKAQDSTFQRRSSLCWSNHAGVQRSPDVSSLRVVPRQLDNAGASSVDGTDDRSKVLTKAGSTVQRRSSL